MNKTTNRFGLSHHHTKNWSVDGYVWSNYSDFNFSGEFWLNFDLPDLALPYTSQVILIMVYGLTTFFAVFGNACVLAVLSFGKFIVILLHCQGVNMTTIIRQGE